MFKKSYTYNPDSLHFEPADKGCKGKIFRIMRIFFGGLLCVFVMYFVYINHFKTIKQQRLEKRNDLLIAKYIDLNSKIKTFEEDLQKIAEKDNNLYRAMLGKEPLGEDLRTAGTGGTDKYAHFEKYQNYLILKETMQNLEKLMNKLNVQENSFSEVSKEVLDHHLMMSSMPGIQPISIKEFKRISSIFGIRKDPVNGRRQMHHGIDYAGPVGTKIYATGDGEIKECGYNKHGYGNEIIIEHYGDYLTRYAHLSKIFIEKGQKVKRGQLIGLMGNTGKSTGPHLHYEVIKNNVHQNPKKYYFNNLSIGEFEQIIKFSQEN